MSIIRAARPDSKFYILDKAISEDKRLGWAARGFLIYLLGKPDHWQVSVQALVNEVSESSEKSARDRTYSIINQLIEAGYIKRTQGKAESGKFASYDYIVSESPHTGYPDTAEPLPVKPTQVSTEVKQVTKKRASSVADAPSGAKAKFDPAGAKPANVSETAWADWCQHRKEIRKPLTAKTCEQQAKALAGHSNPDAVINQSISNGWTGLFPEKVMPGNAPAMSRHHGFSQRDYTAGLIQREDGSYGF